jgi:hypothetical protein
MYSGRTRTRSYSCVCNPLLLRVIGNLTQTMLCIQLALPLFDLGMKGPFANPSCRGWLSEVAHIIRHGIWICNVIYGLLGAFRPTSCMMQCIEDDGFNVRLTLE